MLESNQGTEEWHMERAGRITASMFKDVIAYGKPTKTDAAKGITKGKPLQARTTYLIETVIERICNLPKEGFSSAATSHGNVNEPHARDRYEQESGNLVLESGFIPFMDISGCSPDGLIGEDGGIEIKCPYNSYNHLMSLLHGMPKEHMAQVQGSMMVTSREWWDFVSFDPRFPNSMQIYIQRIPADLQYQQMLLEEIARFDTEVNKYIDDLSDKYNLNNVEGEDNG